MPFKIISNNEPQLISPFHPPVQETLYIFKYIDQTPFRSNAPNRIMTKSYMESTRFYDLNPVALYINEGNTVSIKRGIPQFKLAIDSNTGKLIDVFEFSNRFSAATHHLGIRYLQVEKYLCTPKSFFDINCDQYKKLAFFLSGSLIAKPKTMSVQVDASTHIPQNSKVYAFGTKLLDGESGCVMNWDQYRGATRNDLYHLDHRIIISPTGQPLYFCTNFCGDNGTPSPRSIQSWEHSNNYTKYHFELFSLIG